MQYKELSPRSQKASYASGESIDFLLKIGQGMELLRNSITLHGVLKYTKTDGNTPIAYNDDIMYSHRAGVHNFFDSFVTEMQGTGISENLNEYPRYVNQHAI